MHDVENKFKFEDLNLFQDTLLFINEVYKLTDAFPKSELYALTSQFRRAAVSIALNIGEGAGGTTNEFISFLRIARRSINECLVCILIARNQNYLLEKTEKDLRIKLTQLSKMIAGLIKSLNSKRQP